MASLFHDDVVSNADLIYILALPAFLQDAFDKADKWGNDGKSGRIDPFTDVYNVSHLYSTGVWNRSEFALSLDHFFLYRPPHSQSRPGKERNGS